MHSHQQRVLVLAQPYQATTNEWSSREIKTAVRFFSDQLGQRCLAVSLFTQVVLEQMEATIGGCSNALPWFAFDRYKRGAQSFVTSDDAVERPPQRCAVESPFHLQTGKDVVRLAHSHL